MIMKKLVLLRHGESVWNQQNKFTGWVDVDLSEKGVGEAREAGVLLKSAGFQFDRAFGSMLKRAVRTMWLTLEELDQLWVPQSLTWRLNERHYGALQGLNKAETAKKYGDEQVLVWRRSYDTPPPQLDRKSAMNPEFEIKYKSIPPENLPLTECLKDTVERFLPFWEETIAPRIIAGENLLIVAHGNTLRALIKHLEQLSEKEIVDLNVPTGIPLVYELSDNLEPLRKYYLGDEAKASSAAAAVAAQSKT